MNVPDGFHRGQSSLFYLKLLAIIKSMKLNSGGKSSWPPFKLTTKVKEYLSEKN